MEPSLNSIIRYTEGVCSLFSDEGPDLPVISRPVFFVCYRQFCLKSCRVKCETTSSVVRNKTFCCLHEVREISKWSKTSGRTTLWPQPACLPSAPLFPRQTPHYGPLSHWPRAWCQSCSKPMEPRMSKGRWVGEQLWLRLLSKCTACTPCWLWVEFPSQR